jgi:hypothetical protein
MKLKVKSLYNQYVDIQSRLILLLCLVTVLIGVSGILINCIFKHYPANNYLPLSWWILLPFDILILFVAWYAREMVPRLAFFTRFYTLYFLVSFSMAVMTNGIQLTPFPTIDSMLAHWDQQLGISTPAIIAWTATHHPMRLIFEIAYTAVTFELFILPTFLAIVKLERPLNEYLFLVTFSFIIGAVIYYFFPTAAPSSIFHSPYFLHVERDTALKFYQIHHYIQPTTTNGGLIAFPSFHVIYAIVCAYVVRNKKWLFIPVVMINSVAILATVGLGWHYLIDVIAAIVLAALSIILKEIIKLRGNRVI